MLSPHFTFRALRRKNVAGVFSPVLTIQHKVCDMGYLRLVIGTAFTGTMEKYDQWIYLFYPGVYRFKQAIRHCSIFTGMQ
jgi:hypothetical protein